MGKALTPRLKLISEEFHLSYAVPSFGGCV